MLGISSMIKFWRDKTPEHEMLALYHRGEGLKGLQRAIDEFSEDNADAIMASSAALTWYGCNR
jgi:hypothetical protein